MVVRLNITVIVIPAANKEMLNNSIVGSSGNRANRPKANVTVPAVTSHS